MTCAGDEMDGLLDSASDIVPTREDIPGESSSIVASRDHRIGDSRRPREARAEKAASHPETLHSPSTLSPTSLSKQSYKPRETDEDESSEARGNNSASGEEDVETFASLISVEDHYFAHFTHGLFCSQRDHDREFEKHLQGLSTRNQSHDQCVGIDFLRDLSDPTLQANDAIPHILNQPYLYRGRVAYDTNGVTTSFGKPNLSSLLTPDRHKDARELFEGIRDPRQSPPNVCLFTHEPTLADPAPEISVDFDSVCGFAGSFEAFPSGLQLYLWSTAADMIQGRVHGVSVDVQLEDGSTRAVLIEEIPHIPIAHLLHWSQVRVYLCFPRIYTNRSRHSKSTANLTRSQKEMLYDCVLAPAMLDTLTPSLLSDLPPSFAAVEARAHARQERGSRAPLQSFSQRVGFELPGAFLGALWEAIEQGISELTIDDFAEPLIFFDGKDLKRSTHSASYTQLSTLWTRMWEGNIDEDFLVGDREFWWDWGRQLAPPRGSAILWKACCLAHYRHEKAKISGSTTLVPLVKYPLAGLRDTCSYSITPARGSWEHRGGSIYTQFYAKAKTNFISSTIEAIVDPSIDVLAYGEDHVTATANVGSGEAHSAAKSGPRMARGKARITAHLQPRDDYRAGVLREESRLSGRISRQLLQRLVEEENVRCPMVFQSPPLNPDEHAAQVAPEEPAQQIITAFQDRLVQHFTRLHENNDSVPVSRRLPFWSLPSEVFYGFLRGNVNKHLLGFEKHLSLMTEQSVPRNVTAAALLFLTAARYSLLSKRLAVERVLYQDQWTPAAAQLEDEDDVFASPGPPESDLDASDSRGSGNVRHGLNLRHSIKQFGYAWWSSKIDWKTWEVKEPYANHFFLDEPEFARRFTKRRAQVAIVDNSLRLCELGAGWIAEHGSHLSKLRLVLDFCVGLIMAQFRRDCWDHLYSLGRLEDASAGTALRIGDVPLTHATLSKHLKGGLPDLAISNRTFYRQDPRILLVYLFTNDPVDQAGRPKERGCWRNKPFRAIFNQIYRTLVRHVDPITTERWVEDLFKTVLATNPMLPIPDNANFMQRRNKSRDVFSWATFDFPLAVGPLKEPASYKQVIQKTFPNGLEIRHATITSSTNASAPSVFWSHAVPTLRFEKIYLGRETSSVRRVAQKEITRAGEGR